MIKCLILADNSSIIKGPSDNWCHRCPLTLGEAVKWSILGVLKSFCLLEDEASYSQLAADVPDGDDARRVGEVEVRRFTFGGVGPSSDKASESSKASSSMSLIWKRAIS